MTDARKRLADWAFLLALMLYMLAGVRGTPQHGDEFMQVSMARDYFYTIQGEWARMAYAPPVQPDTEQHLRLLNGVLNKLMVGVAWQINGFEAAALPGIYAWELPLAENQARGNVPTLDELTAARWPSAILMALGVIPMFILGWHLRLRSLAYPAALLYALHPAILLNGRRAMLEGGLMLFSLLVMAWLVAVITAEHSATARGLARRMPAWARYVVLGGLIGLAVAAKHTGVVVGGAALFVAFITSLAGGKLSANLGRAVVRVGLAGVVAGAVLLALNPAYWRDPVGALGATLEARAALLESQSQDVVMGYTSALDRVGALVVQPFLTPPQYFEAPNWVGVLDEAILTYEQSPINGWNWGVLFGGALTALAGIGLAALVYDALHRDLIAWAILAWAGGTTIYGLTIPLNWARYYLPWILVMIVLAAAGMGRLLVQRDSET